MTNPAPSEQPMSSEGSNRDFDMDSVHDAMARLVIQQSLPFNHFDNPRFTKMVQETLQPHYKQVSGTTLIRESFKMWKEAKKQIISDFENLNTTVGLTVDVWSDACNWGSYLCVTAHWIQPESWQMMRRIIAFELFGDPRRDKQLFCLLNSVIQTFKLQGKIFSISFDDASNYANVIEKLKSKYKPPLNGVFFHSRCVTRIITLTVRDALAVKDVNDITEQLRAMLSDVFHHSRNRHAKYRELCHEMGSACLYPTWSIPTEWDSTCEMFETVLKQRETLEVFHNDLVSRGKATSFNTKEWETIEKLSELLHVFKTATTCLSGVYHPTSSLVLHQLYLMCKKLKHFEYSDDVFEKIIIPMKESLKRIFREMSPVFTCAAALNPCLNVIGVETLIDQICEDLDLQEGDISIAGNVKQLFDICIRNTFCQYVEKHGSVTTTHDSMVTDSSRGSSSRNSMLCLYDILRKENSKRARSTPSSELERYIETDFISTMRPEEFENFDILNWWKENESQYPVIAVMARDLLTVQASTLALDSAFCFDGRVLSARKARLEPDALEMCICLKDHLDAMERVQHVRSCGIEPDVKDDFEHEEPLCDDELGDDEGMSIGSEEE